MSASTPVKAWVGTHSVFGGLFSVFISLLLLEGDKDSLEWDLRKTALGWKRGFVLHGSEDYLAEARLAVIVGAL